MSDLAIGIDLGTTYSCVSFIRNGKIEIVQDELGKNTFPSIVSFLNNNIEVGYSAQYEKIKNFKNTICNIKRIIGIPYDDIDKKEKEKYKDQLEKNPDNNFSLITINDNNNIKKYSPEQIYSFIFKYIIKLIEKTINKKTNEDLDVVLTVPANFNYFQINATRIGAKMAGLNVIRLIKEPTSAVITYLYYTKNIENKKIIVFDFGGGTLDISIAKTYKNSIEIIYTEGDNNLGGVNFDDRLVEFCAKNFREKTGLDVYCNLKSLTKLKLACENAKKDLSYMEETLIDIDNLMNGNDFNIFINRVDFENLCEDLFEKAINILKNALENSHLNKEDISEIILIGGSSKIPKIRNEINKILNLKTKLILEQNYNIEEFVAKGATIQHAIIKRLKNFDINFFVSDIYPKSIGVMINENKILRLIPQHSPIPIEKKSQFKSSVDYIEKMNFTIYEGDNNNNFKKIVQLSKKIPSKPAGEVIVYLIVKIDINSRIIIEIKDNISNDQIRKEIDIPNIYQFKINQNVSENISKTIYMRQNIRNLEDDLNNKNNENDKIKILKELISFYNEYLEKIDIKISENQTYVKDYILYLRKLINKYHELYQINKKMINLNDDFKKIENLLERVKPSQINDLFSDLRKLEIFKEYYFNFMVSMISKLKIGCSKCYLDNKNMADYFLKIIYKISDELLKQQLSKYTSLYDKYNKIIKECEFYERRIKAAYFIEEGDKEYKELKKNKNPNKESYYSINRIFNKALGIVFNKNKKIKDNDYTVIIIIRIIVIKYKYNDMNKEDIFKNYSRFLQLDKNELFDKKENKEWFEELSQIIIKIIDIEYDKNTKNKAYLNFIKLILLINPNENKITHRNYVEDYKNDPIDLVRKLSLEYHPDNPKITENEIFNKIIYKLNDLINKLRDSNDESSTHSSIEL